MRNFFIIENLEKPQTTACARKISDYLTERGAKCISFGNQSFHGADYHYTNKKQVPEDTECVIVLGGDGTLIQAAHDLRGSDHPLIGVNLGHLGYLSEIEEDKLFPTLDSLLNDCFFTEERMALQGEIVRDSEVILSDFALNDIVLSRLNSMHMIQFSIYVDGQFLTRYRADGIIISTPTGSTAYSLSAGGPIVLPTSFLFVLTLICAHTLSNTRSIVLPCDVEIELRVEEKDAGHASDQAVSFDSDQVFNLLPGDIIRIRRAKDNVRLIKLTRTSFLETLAKKLS